MEEPLELAGGAVDDLAGGGRSVLRLLSARAPVVMAIDDVQWLDTASRRVLSFAVRRLADTPLAILATLRTPAEHSDPLALANALGPSGLTEIELAGLTARSIQQLVRTRLGVRLPRPLLTRVHRTSGGNPMFALELARMLPASSESAGAPLPLPDSLQELVRARVATLPNELLPLVRLVAVLERPTLEQLGRAFASEENARRLVDLGFEHAVVDIAADGVVRFAHTLLASAVYADVAPAARAELHYGAAEITDDDEERARHLALAASAPDVAVARLSTPPRRARRRAAHRTQQPSSHVHALRLTAPEDSASRAAWTFLRDVPDRSKPSRSPRSIRAPRGRARARRAARLRDCG